MKSKHVVVLLGFALAAAAAVGCGGTSDNAAAGATSAGGGFSAAPDVAPEFHLQTIHGGEVRLSDSNGKVRLIDFWATWCVPCVEEIPMLKKLHEKYRGRSWHKAMDAMQAMRDHGTEFNILTVVSEANMRHGAEVYEWLVGQGFNEIQFIPCREVGPDGRPLDTKAGVRMLEQVAGRIREAIRDVPGVAGPNVENIGAKPYLEFEIHRDRVGHYGLTLGDVQQAIMTAIEA